MTDEQLDAMAMTVKQLMLSRDAVGRPITLFQATEIVAKLVEANLSLDERYLVAQRSGTVTKADIARFMGKDWED